VKHQVRRPVLLVIVACLSIGFAACERESRPFQDLPAASQRPAVETQTPLFAGAPLPPSGATSPYQQNAWAQSEGKRLFTTYNCSGCHANGGGGIGPPLMDDEWIYGFLPGNIYSSIVEGRPDGMPTFRGKIPDYQVWQLVAYVQSMSGQTPIDTSSGRSDHMQAHRPEIIQPYQGRRQTGHK
jgi:cytochrome c oxidase cbb3-type subunit III